MLSNRYLTLKLLSEGLNTLTLWTRRRQWNYWKGRMCLCT